MTNPGVTWHTQLSRTVLYPPGALMSNPSRIRTWRICNGRWQTVRVRGHDASS